MIDGKVIRGVHATGSTFCNGFKRIKDPKLQVQIRDAIRSLLLLDLDQKPAKMHLHQLVNKKVASALKPGHKVSPWTFHVTAGDEYKASFTLEDGVAYLRVVDEHDVVDKNP